MTPDDWQDRVRAPRLSDRVPVDVRMVFDEAREQMPKGHPRTPSSREDWSMR